MDQLKYKVLCSDVDIALEIFEHNDNTSHNAQSANIRLQAVQAKAMIDIAESLAKIAGKTGVVFTKNAGAE